MSADNGYVLKIRQADEEAKRTIFSMVYFMGDFGEEVFVTNDATIMFRWIVENAGEISSTEYGLRVNVNP